MDIRIIKGEREDRIEARRRDGSVAMTVFPKKGPVPHDAVHYLVEQELGIDQGFWGMVAAGRQPEEIGGLAKAYGHASAKRASVPDPRIVPILQAERIVECFEADLWGGGSDNDSLRAMARAGCEQSLIPFLEMRDSAIDRIRSRLADLRDEWAQLPAGQAIELHWQENPERSAA